MIIIGDCNVCINRKLPPCNATCIECGMSWKNFKPMTMTNADKFRSMSDEELADFYSNKLDVCPPEHDSSKCIDELYAHGEGPYPSDKQCMECWLNWLKREGE